MVGYALMANKTADSYNWVLDKFRLFIGVNVILVTLITDCDLGPMNVVREVFPNSVHLLCRWHINKDVQSRVNAIMATPMVGRESTL